MLAGKGLELKLISNRNYGIALYEKVYGVKAARERRFYNIGAGNFSHPCWTNVDYFNDWYKTNSKFLEKGIHYDLFSLQPLPLEENSAELLYTSHTVEHIRNQEAEYLFSEAFRVLKTGGIFRLTMPDIDLHYTAYRRNDYDFFYWREWYASPEKYSKIFINRSLMETSIEQLFLYQVASSVSEIHSDGVPQRIGDAEFRALLNKHSMGEALDICLKNADVEIQKKYPGNHINWWNAEKAAKMLKDAGFSTVYKSGYGQSASPVLRNTDFFDSTHPKMSLYIEAVKK